MQLTNPYPSSVERHPVQIYVAKGDWQYLQSVTGSHRGWLPSLCATFINQLVADMRRSNLPPYNPTTSPDAIKHLIQRVSVRVDSRP
jgi:hypothetical protein